MEFSTNIGSQSELHLYISILLRILTGVPTHVCNELRAGRSYLFRQVMQLDSFTEVGCML